MATKTLVELVDDIDGSDADTTVLFSYQGVQFEIDLSKANAQAMDADLKKWVESARRVGGKRASKSSSNGGSSSSKKIREWAQANNVPVKPRGRIPAEVEAAYEAARGGSSELAAGQVDGLAATPAT